jgi:amylosucrase
MYTKDIHRHLGQKLKDINITDGSLDTSFLMRYSANITTIQDFFYQIYGNHGDVEKWYDKLLSTINNAYDQRSIALKKLDIDKESGDIWYLSNEIVGMSLYVDRFCGTLKDLEQKLDYFQELGINFLHLMPVMESPEGASDGGYAVSDFRSVASRFGTIEDLRSLEHTMKSKGMYLMLDIVLNHTSQEHVWAKKAAEGDKAYQDYFYMYDNRELPDAFERTMPDIFPDSSPGSFTYLEESKKWVMSVFNSYQWDLNYTNPAVFIEMLDTIFFYANLGVDVLRIDAPAFIWKSLGTTSQNLPEAHVLLQLIKHCVQVSAPGMALLGEAIVAPKEIMKYFGTGRFTGRECDVAYNATQMALQWDALATGDTRVMLSAQSEILKKPYGTTWITYTRCHDDIGLGYDDSMIQSAGYNPYSHRTFIKDYYAGNYRGSVAKGALFGVNPKTNDARISGTLASLCGLEYGINHNLQQIIKESLNKIALMQAQSILLGGLPMLYYGDEIGYTNDYTYLNDPGKDYDNRWMHRPLIDWSKNEKRKTAGTLEYMVFENTKKILNIRKSYKTFGDHNNIRWMSCHNIHVAGYVRYGKSQSYYCLFNYSGQNTFLTYYIFKEQGLAEGITLTDLWSGEKIVIGRDDEYLSIKPYQFFILSI